MDLLDVMEQKENRCVKHLALLPFIIVASLSSAGQNFCVLIAQFISTLRLDSKVAS